MPQDENDFDKMHKNSGFVLDFSFQNYYTKIVLWGSPDSTNY